VDITYEDDRAATQQRVDAGAGGFAASAGNLARLISETDPFPLPRRPARIFTNFYAD
jgi:hypothetical protein